MDTLPERIVAQLLKKYPCRETFMEELYDLFPANGEECFPNAVYIFGLAATGKTAIVRDLLELYKKKRLARTAFVDCIECYSLRIMVELLMEQLTAVEESTVWNQPNGTQEDSVVDLRKDDDEQDEEEKKISTIFTISGKTFSFERMEQFIEYLSQIDYYSKNNSKNSSKIINNYLLALDNAERLRDVDANILCSLLRLQEYTRLNISIILISRLPLEKFFPRNGLNEQIITIYCPAYSRSDLLSILNTQFESRIKPKIKNWIGSDSEKTAHIEEGLCEVSERINNEFYENYLNIFMGVIFKLCRDFRELQITAESCFRNYVKPVLDGSIDVEDVTRLWRSVTDTFRVAMAQLYVRVEKFLNLEQEILPSFPEINTGHMSTQNSVRQMVQALELPFYAKFLLIASFLASYNSAKDDNRLFVKNHRKQRKRIRNVVAKTKVTEKMSTSLGPKSFNIDRLLAIFYAIIENRVGLTCNLLAQISTLVQLRLLTFVSGENNVIEGTARLQCTVNLEFIVNIGKIVNFNVSQYLCDFC